MIIGCCQNCKMSVQSAKRNGCHLPIGRRTHAPYKWHSEALNAFMRCFCANHVAGNIKWMSTTAANIAETKFLQIVSCHFHTLTRRQTINIGTPLHYSFTK